MHVLIVTGSDDMARALGVLLPLWGYPTDRACCPTDAHGKLNPRRHRAAVVDARSASAGLVRSVADAGVPLVLLDDGSTAALRADGPHRIATPIDPDELRAFLDGLASEH